MIVDGQEINAETTIVNNRTMVSTEFIRQYVTGNNEEAEMSHTEKALALINSFASGDTTVADELMAEGYIQHNLHMAPEERHLKILFVILLPHQKKQR